MIKSIIPSKAIAEIYAFLKAQVSAFVGGIVDFLIMIAAVELAGFHYIHGIILGGIIGALVNYSINRHWAFSTAGSNEVKSELSKFFIVVLGSIALKSLGTHLLTQGLQLDYRLSRIIVDALVCFGFNYSLHRLWVFKSST